MSSDEWLSLAACKGKPTEWWYPEAGQTTARAKAICAMCPVVTECANDAADRGETAGMWGGVLFDVRKPRARDRVRVKDRVLRELQLAREWVTVQQLSERTGVHFDSVRRALRELQAEHRLQHEPGGYWKAAA